MDKLEKNLVNYMKNFEEKNNREHISMKEHMCKIEEANSKEHEKMRLNHVENAKDMEHMIESITRISLSF